MGCKVIVLCLIYLAFATVQAVEVSLTNAWKENVGWQINCTWTIPANDTLQSVRLYKNNQQFQIFRPQIDGSGNNIVYKSIENIMSTRCAVTDAKKQNGTCVITLELYQPQREDITVSCEVSGEGPFFRIKRKDRVVEKFVPPTTAVVSAGPVDEATGRVTLNCTAGGVPAPKLLWNVGAQKVPRDFSGGAWNATSKLWQAWSSLTYTPSFGRSAVCTPESSLHGMIVKGEPAVYNAARNINGGVFNIIIMTVISLLLLR